MKGASLISSHPSTKELHQGARAVITSMIGIDENSRVYPHMVKAYGEKFVSGLSEVVN